MTGNPLVTISIPTLNSGQFLELCLDAIERQTYQNIEVNIIDGASSDDTVKIAEQHGIDEIIICTDALLKARHEGLIRAHGKYILLLDSDQILEPAAVERSVNMLNDQDLDMLVLEEDVYQANNWLEKLFQLDRKLIHTVKDFDPYTSVMLPRFYKTDLLKKAFAAIPKSALENVGGQDHAIIYFEAYLYSQKIDLLPGAVQHIEPNSLRAMFKKFYRWGYTSQAAHESRYEELLERKERFRKGMFRKGTVKASLASITLLLIKGVPYYIGKLNSRGKRSNNR